MLKRLEIEDVEEVREVGKMNDVEADVEDGGR